MSFEIQELRDVIRVIVLINLSEGMHERKTALKQAIDRVCTGFVCVETTDFDSALHDMTKEGLIADSGESVQLTDRGIELGAEWRNLLLKKEPILEVVAGLVDGSITGLVVIISTFVANLSIATAAFAAFLTLTAVAVTNFSSFLLGGITEDLADMITLQTLINYSLSDIADIEERNKSLMLIKELFKILHKQISRSNIIAAVVSGTTTFLAGSIPIAVFMLLPRPLNAIISFAMIALVTGVFLVRYRSKRTRVHWKITLLQTVLIVTIAVAISLLVGGSA